MRSALAVLLALLAAAPAAAHQRQESVFMDDNLLLYRGPQRATETLRELKEMGVDRVRVTLHWHHFAPDARKTRRPPGELHYGPPVFDNHDHLLREARDLGIEVLVNVSGSAPLWATGKHRGRHLNGEYKPDPAEFGRFVEMLGRRYDGRRRDENQGERRLPRITAWSIWNEPNLGSRIQPQWERGRPASPRIYRDLVRSALAALDRSGHARDIVLLGETAPRGRDTRARTISMRPGVFLRELLCLDRDLLPDETRAGCDYGESGRLEVTGFAHHPYSITSPPDVPHPHPDDITLADRDRLTRILDAAAGLGRIPPSLPLWYTEYGYQTLPPDPIRGVDPAEHAAWLVKAERMTFLDERVAAHTQFQLLDDPPRRNFRRTDRRYWGTYQSGLKYVDGRRKPAYDAYRLGLDAPSRVAPGQPLRLWGFVRAAPNGESQTVQLEVREPGSSVFVPAGDPVPVLHDRGYFEVERPPRAGEWRFAWRGMASNAVAVTVG
ncbi:MAG TPA: hypothetical protein VHF89_03840 [Solirubrobacteraceae bacterium]|nr:hypothetical protein [Solirubrobacteraceae bacterium]